MKSLLVQKPARIAVLLTCLAAAVFVAKSSSAGAKFSTPVTINTATRTIDGSFGSARNSGDTQQLLRFTHLSGLTSVDAKTSAGVTASCSTSNAGLLNLLLNAADSTHVFVQFNASGTCTDVILENASTHPTKSQ